MIRLDFNSLNDPRLSFLGEVKNRLHGLISTNIQTSIQLKDGTWCLAFVEIAPSDLRHLHSLYFSDGDDAEYRRDFRDKEELMQFFKNYEFKDIDPKHLDPFY